MDRRTASISVMEPLMSEILPRDSARFSSLPVERSSSTTTLSPRRTSSSTTLEPMKPAPPVTTYRMRTFLHTHFVYDSRLLRSIAALLVGTSQGAFRQTHKIRFDTLECGAN